GRKRSNPSAADLFQQLSLVRNGKRPPMLFQCKVCGPATDHGSAPTRFGKAKPWRTIDIHCHCMVPEANAMVLKATGIAGGGETPNANAHVNALTRSIQPQRGKIDFAKLTDLDTRLADMDRGGIDVQVSST